MTREELFAAFARDNGLSMYPDPTGERYLFPAEGAENCCKKNEHVELIDELWNALVKAKGGSEDLLLGKE